MVYPSAGSDHPNGATLSQWSVRLKADRDALHASAANYCRLQFGDNFIPNVDPNVDAIKYDFRANSGTRQMQWDSSMNLVDVEAPLHKWNEPSSESSFVDPSFLQSIGASLFVPLKLGISAGMATDTPAEVVLSGGAAAVVNVFAGAAVTLATTPLIPLAMGWFVTKWAAEEITGTLNAPNLVFDRIECPLKD